MSAWSKDELREIAEADDLHVSLFRDDGVTDDRSAAYCRRRPRFNQTVAALCPRGRIASKFAITIH
jgi:hypothetical protein